MCGLVQSESEVRVFGGDFMLSTGKGKGTGTVGVRSGGLRSEIGGLGVGGMSGTEVNAAGKLRGSGVG